MLDEFSSAGHDLQTVLADRGFSNWDVGSWADELLRRDIDQVIDVNPSDRDARLDPKTGALMIDGGGYLPETHRRRSGVTPDPLRRPEPGAAPGPVRRPPT
jgi:hypothetical protein